MIVLLVEIADLYTGGENTVQVQNPKLTFNP